MDGFGIDFPESQGPDSPDMADLSTKRTFHKFHLDLFHDCLLLEMVALMLRASFDIFHRFLTYISPSFILFLGIFGF